MHACLAHANIMDGVRRVKKVSDAYVKEILKETRAPVGVMQLF